MTMQLIDAVRHYRNAMVVQGRSPYTVRGAKSALKSLMAFLAASQITQIEQLDHDVLMRYREALSWRVTPKGTVLNPRSQSELLGHMRVFCRWLVEQDWLPADPSRRVPHPRAPKQLPKAIMAFEEVQRVLHQPDLRTAGGFRDRVILEVLYTSAIRRSEVASLMIDDVDIEHGFLIVRRGKNNKDRAVPVGSSVCALLATYLAGIRADWRGAGQDRHLFHREGSQRGGGLVEAGVYAQLPARLRHAHDAGRCTDPASARDAWACVDREHADLHTRDDQRSAGSASPLPSA
jgi:integrase/recombinase XerD